METISIPQNLRAPGRSGRRSLWQRHHPRWRIRGFGCSVRQTAFRTERVGLPSGRAHAGKRLPEPVPLFHRWVWSQKSAAARRGSVWKEHASPDPIGLSVVPVRHGILDNRAQGLPLRSGDLFGLPGQFRVAGIWSSLPLYPLKLRSDVMSRFPQVCIDHTNRAMSGRAEVPGNLSPNCAGHYGIAGPGE